MSEGTTDLAALTTPSSSSSIAIAAVVMGRKVLLAPPECLRWCEAMTEQERTELIQMREGPHGDQGIAQILQAVADRLRPLVAEAASDAPAAEDKPVKRRK